MNTSKPANERSWTQRQEAKQTPWDETSEGRRSEEARGEKGKWVSHSSTGRQHEFCAKQQNNGCQTCFFEVSALGAMVEKLLILTLCGNQTKQKTTFADVFGLLNPSRMRKKSTPNSRELRVQSTNVDFAVCCGLCQRSQGYQHIQCFHLKEYILIIDNLFRSKQLSSLFKRYLPTKPALSLGTTLRAV
jgi:hypothetical protein